MTVNNDREVEFTATDKEWKQIQQAMEILGIDDPAVLVRELLFQRVNKVMNTQQQEGVVLKFNNRRE